MVGDGAGVLVRRALVAAGVDPETPDALARFLRDLRSPPARHHRAVSRCAGDAVDGVAAGAAVRPHQQAARSHRCAFSTRSGCHRISSALIGGDGPHGRKPDPAGLRRSLAGREHVLLVGDSPVDWQTAQAAGCASRGRATASAPCGSTAIRRTRLTCSMRPSDLAAVLDRLRALHTDVARSHRPRDLFTARCESSRRRCARGTSGRRTERRFQLAAALLAILAERDLAAERRVTGANGAVARLGVELAVELGGQRRATTVPSSVCTSQSSAIALSGSISMRMDPSAVFARSCDGLRFERDAAVLGFEIDLAFDPLHPDRSVAGAHRDFAGQPRFRARCRRWC